MKIKQSKAELKIGQIIEKIIKHYTLIIKDNISLQSVYNRNEIAQINQKLN